MALTQVPIELSSTPGIVDNSNTTAITIDSSEQVGIGTSNPNHKLEIRNDVAASADLDPTAIKLYNNNDGGSAIEFSNGVAAKSKISFGVTSTGAGTNDSYLSFSTGANAGLSEALRIDASGNLLVGKTSTGTTTAGSQLNADGLLTATRDGNYASILTRLNSDGDILLFRKDGTTVGSIGVNNSTNLYIGSDGETGLKFGATAIVPADSGSSGASSDGDMSLGNSGTRFNNLFLSGGAYLGGTAAANKLDDYETGTWTPAITGTTGAPSVGYANNGGTYTKVGNAVTLFFGIRLSSISGGSGTVRITGLPFASGSYGAYQNPAGIATAQVLTASQAGPILLYVEDNSSSLQGRYLNTNSDAPLPLSLFQGGSYVICTFTYQL